MVALKIFGHNPVEQRKNDEILIRIERAKKQTDKRYTRIAVESDHVPSFPRSFFREVISNCHSRLRRVRDQTSEPIYIHLSDH